MTSPGTAADSSVISVVVVDDQALVRGGLCSILATQPDMRVLAEAAGPAFDLLHRKQRDPVLGHAGREEVPWRLARMGRGAGERRHGPAA